MNRRYLSGRRREYKIKKQMEILGYICSRSAGSHSPWDIVCVNKKWHKIKFIQVKPKSMNGNAKEKIEKEFAWLNDAKFETKFEVAS